MNPFSRFLPGGLRMGHLLAALAGVGLLAVLAPAPTPTLDARAPRAGALTPAPSGQARSEAGSLLGSKRDPFTLQGVADLFSSTSWLPPPPPPVVAKPVAPAFPFHFVGTLADRNTERQVFLAQHGSGVIVTPRVGDLLAGSFKVEAIGGESLSVLYVPLNEKLSVSFASMGPEPGTRAAPGVAPSPEPASSMSFAGGGAAGGANFTAALPPIAGIGIVAATASSPGAAPSTPASATAGGGGAIGVAASTGSAPISGPGASPASPGAAPTGPLGTTAVPTATLGTPPTGSGMLGTPPVNPDSSVLFGPKPTSGGPAVQ